MCEITDWNEIISMLGGLSRMGWLAFFNTDTMKAERVICPILADYCQTEKNKQ